MISEQQWYIKALVGAVVGAFLFGAVPPALKWISDKSDPIELAQQPSIGPLSGLTNTQIRERAIAFAHEIRTYESKYEDAVKDVNDADWLVQRTRPKNEEAAGQSWILSQQRRESLHASYVADFKSKYRSEAVILREELQKRFGGKLPDPPTTHPYGEMALVAGRDVFEGALLTGPHPVSAGADLLEYWAKQLP